MSAVGASAYVALLVPFDALIIVHLGFDRNGLFPELSWPYAKVLHESLEVASEATLHHPIGSAFDLDHIGAVDFLICSDYSMSK